MLSPFALVLVLDDIATVEEFGLASRLRTALRTALRSLGKSSQSTVLRERHRRPSIFNLSGLNVIVNRDALFFIQSHLFLFDYRFLSFVLLVLKPPVLE